MICWCGHTQNQHNGLTVDDDGRPVDGRVRCVACRCDGYEPSAEQQATIRAVILNKTGGGWQWSLYRDTPECNLAADAVSIREFASAPDAAAMAFRAAYAMCDLDDYPPPPEPLTVTRGGVTVTMPRTEWLVCLVSEDGRRLPMPEHASHNFGCWLRFNTGAPTEALCEGYWDANDGAFVLFGAFGEFDRYRPVLDSYALHPRPGP